MKRTALFLGTAIALLMVFSACETDDFDNPVITLVGGDMEIVLNSVNEWTDPGFTATDTKDGDLTANVIVTGTVDVTKIGSYEITYSVSDAAGNKTTVKRIVDVIVDQDLYVGDWAVTESVSTVDTTINISYTATVTKSTANDYTILAKNVSGFGQTFTTTITFTKFGILAIANQPLIGAGVDGTIEGTGTTKDDGTELTVNHTLVYTDASPTETCTGTWTKMK